jgi:hypothetical protein
MSRVVPLFVVVVWRSSAAPCVAHRRCTGVDRFYWCGGFLIYHALLKAKVGRWVGEWWCVGLYRCTDGIFLLLVSLLTLLPSPLLTLLLTLLLRCC